MSNFQMLFISNQSKTFLYLILQKPVFTTIIILTEKTGNVLSKLLFN